MVMVISSNIAGLATNISWSSDFARIFHTVSFICSILLWHYEWSPTFYTSLTYISWMIDFYEPPGHHLHYHSHNFGFITDLVDVGVRASDTWQFVPTMAMYLESVAGILPDLDGYILHIFTMIKLLVKLLVSNCRMWNRSIINLGSKS